MMTFMVFLYYSELILKLIAIYFNKSSSTGTMQLLILRNLLVVVREAILLIIIAEKLQRKTHHATSSPILAEIPLTRIQMVPAITLTWAPQLITLSLNLLF